MFTKAALSRSRLALVLASAFVASVTGAWSAPSAAAATGDSSPAVFAATNDLFYDGATIAMLTRGPALRNGVFKARSVLDAAADLTVSTEATAYVEKEVTWGITKDVDHQGRLEIAAGDTATFTYTLGVTHEIGSDGGWLVYGVIQVRNPNPFEVSGVEVSDAVDNGGTCTVNGNPTATVTVPAYNMPLDLSYSCTYPSAPSPSSGANTATVSWPAIGSPDTSASASAAFDFDGVEPSIGNGSVDVMDPNNPDGALLGSVTIDDPSPTAFSYSVPFSGDPAGTCTDHPNTASITVDQRPLDSDDATARVCVGADLTVAKTAEPSLTRTYTWDISKDVDQTSQTIAQDGTAGFDYTVEVTHDDGVDAWQTTGTIHVSNPNDWEAITADVTDTVDNGGLCTVTGGTDVSIPASGSVDLPYSCTYSSAPSPQDGTNTATASWDQASFSTPDGSASGSAEVKFSTVSPTVVDGSVSVGDPLDSGSPHTVSSTDPSPTAFTYQHDFSGDPAGACTDHLNTATFTTNTTATTGSDSQTVEVCVAKAAANLTVTKTAQASFTRTFTWGITMSVDPASQNIAAGDSASVSYAAAVTHDAGTDSDWQVAGTITVSNPNESGAITLTGVEDAVPGGSCSITSGDPHATIDALGHVTLDYVCHFTSDPGSGTNTATATWDATAASTPDGTASGTAGFTFGAPTTTVDGSVTVTDTLGGTLGTVSSTDSSPTTFTDHQHFSGDQAGTCTSHPNTATFTTNTTGTTGSDTSSAEVCVANTAADLTVTKTAHATYTRTYKWGITKSADPASRNITAGDSAPFTYAVAVTHDSGTDSDWQVTGTITVSNPNDSGAITLTGVEDAIPGGTCSITSGDPHATIPALGSVTLDYACSFASNPGSGTNTATATWDAAAASTPDGSASGTASFAFGAPTTTVDGSVSVGDPLDSGSPHTVSSTDPSPTAFTYQHDFSGDPAGACTDHLNTATFTTNTTATTGSDSQTVEVCVAKAAANLTVTKTAQASFTRTFTWGITMSVDPASQNIAAGDSASVSYAAAVTHDAGTDSDWQVTGTITVTNPNDSGPITLTGVEDAVPGGSCSITSGDPHATIDALGHVTLDYVCHFTSDPGSGTNTATATWDATAASTPDGTASGTAGFTFGAPTTTVDGSVTVTDTLGGTLGTVSSTDSSPTTFTDHQEFSGDQAGTCTSHPNTATFTTNTTGTTGSDTSSATVCAGRDIAVAKTATTSFTRTYKWKITKSVAAPTTVTQPGGTTTAFAYTVNVTGDGYADSAWAVSGKITLTNPNDWQAVTVSLADSLPGCTLGNTSVTVPKSGSVDVGYTCPLPNGSSGTNTATATWDTTAFPTPHSSATATAAFAFGAPTTEINKTVTVTDTFNGSTSTLGTVGYPSPGTFSYSRTVTVPTANCVTYPNTARIVETGQSAGASVTACASTAGSPHTGALTMGFWQNKNGQGIIAAANQANLLAFLKSYAPFSDASAPLTTYATTVIKAANASGTSMNPMLKAQMLATAFDVYFSDPARGGNKINAPSPIGGVRIDLTHVPPIGNTSLAFGGATSMTVSQTLAYAASQSNAGGSMWYGNVKSTQELAKDVFDAINNEWAVPI